MGSRYHLIIKPRRFLRLRTRTSHMDSMSKEKRPDMLALPPFLEKGERKSFRLCAKPTLEISPHAAHVQLARPCGGGVNLLVWSVEFSRPLIAFRCVLRVGLISGPRRHG